MCFKKQDIYQYKIISLSRGGWIRKEERRRRRRRRVMAERNSVVEEQKVSFVKLFSFADRLDVLLMVVGSMCAVASGLSQPLMALIFGQLINSFGSSDQSHVLNEVSKVHAYTYIYKHICVYMYTLSCRF